MKWVATLGWAHATVRTQIVCRPGRVLNRQHHALLKKKDRDPGAGVQYALAILREPYTL